MALYERNYQNEVVPKLAEQFRYKSSMQIPRIEKSVVNMGLGEAIQNSRSSIPLPRNWLSLPGRRPLSPGHGRASPPSSCAKGCPSMYGDPPGEPDV